MPRIGLVLGGGGLAGTAFHAGVITALWAELGWDARTAQVVVGTSAGSTSALLLRAGLRPSDFLARMTGVGMSPAGARLLEGAPALVHAPRRRGEVGAGAASGPSLPDEHRAAAPTLPGRLRALAPASPATLLHLARHPWPPRPGALAAGLLPTGRYPNDDIRAGFDRMMPRWPEEPTWLCAVRLRDGERVVFGRDAGPGHADPGDAQARGGAGPGGGAVHASPGQAVAASCAVPGYYAPVRIGPERYVDGAIHSVCNADLVAGLGLDAVLVSAPMSTSDWVHAARGRPWRAPLRAQLAREVRAVVAGGTPVLVLHPTRADREVMAGAWMDATKRPAIARRVAESVAGRLAAAVEGGTRGEGHPVVAVLRHH